jgi:hypothetical protein
MQISLENTFMSLARFTGEAARVALGGSAFSSVFGAAASLDGLSGTDRLEAMFQRQIAMQQQHELFSMKTNLARTEHESRMTAIRNMRA